MFRNKLKSEYKTASSSFEKAFQKINDDPADSVGYANSVLESIIKEILKDKRFSDINATKWTNKRLVSAILKKFELEPNSEIPKEIKTIGSSLAAISDAIGDLRSDKTSFHGHASDKYLINEPLYAYLTVNACATIGLFLINYYENKFPKVEKVNEVNI